MNVRTGVVVAVLACAAGVAVAGDGAVYEVEIVNTWSTATHPGAFPEGAHFSWFGGAVHSAGVSFWEVGELASPGMKRMAETGATDVLVETEVQAALDAGTALVAVEHRHWFCPPETMSSSCGSLTFEIEATEAYPLVTLVSMLGPTPDWFVGVSGLSLRDGGAWAEEIVIDLRPYDGGTRDNNAFALFGPLTTPPDPITLITAGSGQLITPASLGSMVFRLVEPACAADLDGDGRVGSADLAQVLGFWGLGGVTDLDGDGTTGGGDLAIVLAAWGDCGA